MKRLDLLLALGAIAACETELVLQVDASPGRTALGAAMLAVGAAAVAWRRRAPVVASCVTVAFTLGAVVLVPAGDLVTPQYVLFLPPYTIGAWSTRSRASAGIAICLAAFGVFGLATSASATSWAFGAGMLVGSFFVGRAVRTERLLVTDLESVAASIAQTREESSSLVVEDVRARISEDVNVLVAETIASMVVAGEAALRLLSLDIVRADAAMLAVEEMGRDALSEMRRVLGSIRHEPQELPSA